MQALWPLNDDQVNVLYRHTPDPNTPLEESAVAFDELHKKGLFKQLAYHSALNIGDGIIIGGSKTSQIDNNVKDIAKGPLAKEAVDAMKNVWDVIDSLDLYRPRPSQLFSACIQELLFGSILPSMSSNTNKAKVIVCGAGPVGALAALYAAKRGANVHVYELRDDLRHPSTTPLNFTKSINLALSERGINAIRYAGAEGLLEDLFQDTVPMHARMIHGRRQSGQLFEESQKYDARGRYIRAVDRAGLNKSLLDALDRLPNVSLHFNHKLTGANFDKKTAWFEQCDHPRQTDHAQNPTQPQSSSNDQRRATEIAVDFELFIGADGAHSATRFHMMKYARVNYQQEYIDTLWCEFHIKATKSNDFAIDPHHLHIWPAGSFMFIAIPSPDASFTCTLFAPASHFASISEDSQANLPKFFDQHFPGVSPTLIPTSDLLAQFQNNLHLPLISIKCSPYHYKSSVVILGDAAHAMVPFYGQGMNAGLEDVRVLFSLLDSHGVYNYSAPSPDTADAADTRVQHLASALSAYTDHRTPDAHTINDLALHNYHEMSSNVRSPLYKLRKWMEETVSVWMPWTGWRTQYTRVSFENQRYSELEQEVRRQGRVLMGTLVIGAVGAIWMVGLGLGVLLGVRYGGVGYLKELLNGFVR
ncbi:MAG: hypothetical protein Q9217_002463 [Psora testacea]